MGAVKKLLAEHPEKLQELAESLVERMKEGNGQAIKQLLDRLDGPVKTELDLTSGNQPIKALVGVDVEKI